MTEALLHHAQNGHHIIGIDPQVEDHPGLSGGFAVHPQQGPRVGIFEAREANRAMNPLQEIEFESGRLADLARGDVCTVVADHPGCGQVQWRPDGPADVVDVESAVQQPGDQVDALLARIALEAVEQTQRFEIVRSHVRERTIPAPAARARNSFTSPLIPLMCRAPAKDQVNSSASPMRSCADSATSTVPGRATAVTRLARFTGLPNQSPARRTALPAASPTRN